LRSKTKAVHAGVRKITGKQASRVRVIEDRNGVLLTGQMKVSRRWFEHLSQLYSPAEQT